MFSLAHSHWQPASSSSLAHALGFAATDESSGYIDIQDGEQDADGDSCALFRLPPMPLPMPMGVLIPSPSPVDFPLAPARQPEGGVKPEPAEPTLGGGGGGGALVYVFEHARRTEDGSVSFDLCDEESLLARTVAVHETATAVGQGKGKGKGKRGMKAMMGVFRVDPFTTGQQRVAEEEDDGEEEEEDPGASFEFQMDMDMQLDTSGSSTTSSVSVTGQRDLHLPHVQHDPRPALLPFISAASCPASPISISPSHSSIQMDHHSHSRPSTAASSRSASSFAPTSATPNDSGGQQAKKKPKKVKMHACDVCHKEFPRPSGLQTHMNVHSGAKPYKCPVAGCSKKFGVRSNATRHLRVHQRQAAHAASQHQQHRHNTLASTSTSSSGALDTASWLDLPPDVLRPTPADVLAASHHPLPHSLSHSLSSQHSLSHSSQHAHTSQQQQQRWVPESLQHLTNALELPGALRGPRVELAGVGGSGDAGGSGGGNEWPYHPSQWASKLPGPGPLRQQWAAPSHAWVGA